MKVRRTFVAVVLITLTLIAEATQASRDNNQDLLNMSIENVGLEAANIGLLLRSS